MTLKEIKYMKKWLIGEAKGMMFSVFLWVNMNVVSSSLRADSWTAEATFACCFICIYLPRASSFCCVYREFLAEWDWVSKSGSSLLSTHSTHSHQ